MKNLLSTFVILLVPFLATSQYFLTPEWAKQFGGPNEETPILIKSFDNGDFLVLGYFRDSINLETDPESSYILDDGSLFDELSCMFFAKYAENGDFIWGYKFRSLKIKDFEISHDNEIVIVGNYSISHLDADPGAGEYFLDGFGSESTPSSAVIKLNENGEFIWAANGTTLYLDGGITANCVQLDQDGNIYIGGGVKKLTKFISTSGTEHNFVLTDRNNSAGYLMKLSPDGEFIWSQLVDSNNLSFDEIIVDGDNRVLISGTAYGSFYVDPFGVDEYFSLSMSEASPYIIFFTLEGDYIGTKVFEALKKFVDIEMDNSKNIYLATTFEGYIDADPGPGEDNMYSLSGDMGAIIKLNSVGDYLWGNPYASVLRIHLDPAQDLVAYGKKFVDPFSTDTYFCLFGLNSHGDDVFTDSSYMIVSDFDFGNGNSIITFGRFIGSYNIDTETGPVELVNIGHYDIFLVKMNYDGMLKLEDEMAGQTSIKLYPNPTHEFITIESIHTVNSVTLYDLGGNVLISASSQSLSLNQLAYGVYFLVVETENGIYKTKVIKL